MYIVHVHVQTFPVLDLTQPPRRSIEIMGNLNLRHLFITLLDLHNVSQLLRLGQDNIKSHPMYVWWLYRVVTFRLML